MLWQVMKKAVAITPPTFFSSNTNLFQDSVAALNFGFTGIGVSPCAIAVSPVGVGIGATVSFTAPQNCFMGYLYPLRWDSTASESASVSASESGRASFAPCAAMKPCLAAPSCKTALC